MKKSILIYFGVAILAALALVLFHPGGASGNDPKNTFFTQEKVVTLFDNHNSPVLVQKYFEIYTSEDSIEYFTAVNRERTGIDVQPLTGGDHFTISPDSFYGPDSIKLSFNLIYCYKIVSWDSIFLIDKSGKNVFMSDKEGNISKYWSVSDTICNSPYFILRGYPFSPVVYQDGAIYASFLPFFNTQREIFSCDAIAKVKLPEEGGSIPIDRIFAPYPNIYSQREASFGASGYVGSMVANATSNSTSFVMSFPKDHNMYRVDEYGTAEPIPAKSDWIGSFSPFRGDLLKQDDNMKYESEEPHYLKVMHDPYRHYFYRIAMHRQEFSDGVTNREFHEKPWSIMVFDENFGKLGEQKFEPKQFFPKDVFVGKEGLYISNARVRREGVPKRRLSFTLFKVKPPSI